MEENGDGGGEDLTPFWVQSTTNLRRSDRLRRGVAAVLFSSGLVVFLLLVTAAFFLAFVVPSTISLSANIFKPNSVKKSWDSLNIVLVLVAVVFGFLSRNRNEERSPLFDEFQPSPIKENQSQNSNNQEKSSLYDYHQEKSSLYEYHQEKSNLYEENNLNLRRSSSSYPDLREFSSSSTNWSYGDYQRRFFDDFNVDSSRSSDAAELHHHRRHRSLEQVDYLTSPPQIKTVVVDTLVYKPTAGGGKFPAELAAAPPGEEEVAERVVGDGAAVREGRSSRRFYKDSNLMNPVSAPLPPVEEAPPPEFQESEKRSRERAARKKERSSRRQVYKDVEPTNPIATPPPPPPPPAPPQQKSSKSDRRRGGAAANSTKVFLNSLYSKKKKKQRQKSVDNVDSLLHEAPPPMSFQIPSPSPPPPPPPPPPQPSVFHTLFSSKKPKRKRTITVTVAPLPPSPPPESPPHAAARDPSSASHAPPPPTHKPPKPLKKNNFDRLEEASNSGGESPFRRIPPPPPPPPPSLLKTPAWRFVVQGDYVRVNSSNSSRSGSPDLDETDSDVTPSADAGGGVAALFCPSPDVDTKAESFITNFRAKLKLEKIHSMKKRDVGPSTLGPGPGPNKI
ncbi:hypothetical protein SASPL_141822 [Salvia splendens]|uniref:Uncharacterized protein n=1 Tax=Salvia splendens TaxID=180675 RepID=A0A8X8Z8W0_SALSN|nr:myb-related transcription factor, partner of profilin-like [Salvia splendens]KAG6395698.1 hypothetical protein SASPL_141822 [Salvia splendens]